MAKLLLLSSIISVIAIPIMCARESNPRRGMQKLALMAVLYNLFYLFAVRFIYPRLL